MDKFQLQILGAIVVLLVIWFVLARDRWKPTLAAVLVLVMVASVTWIFPRKSAGQVVYAAETLEPQASGSDSIPERKGPTPAQLDYQHMLNCQRAHPGDLNCHPITIERPSAQAHADARARQATTKGFCWEYLEGENRLLAEDMMTDAQCRALYARLGIPSDGRTYAHRRDDGGRVIRYGKTIHACRNGGCRYSPQEDDGDTD